MGVGSGGAFRKDTPAKPEISGGNAPNLWAIKYSRPLLITRGHHEQADALLNFAGAASALVVPLFVSNRVMGSLQLFSQSESAFSQEDAHLLVILSLWADNWLTRQHST